MAISGAAAIVGSRCDNDNGSASGSADQNGTLTVNDATPNTMTYLAYGLVGLGSAYVGPLNFTLALDQPRQAGSVLTSDPTGTAIWTIPIPPAASGLDVWIEACQFERRTNVVATNIQ